MLGATLLHLISSLFHTKRRCLLEALEKASKKVKKKCQELVNKQLACNICIFFYIFQVPQSTIHICQPCSMQHNLTVIDNVRADGEKCQLLLHPLGMLQKSKQMVQLLLIYVLLLAPLLAG